MAAEDIYICAYPDERTALLFASFATLPDAG